MMKLTHLLEALGRLLRRLRTFLDMPDEPVEDYMARGCAGRAWRSAFPAASKQELRGFLRCLTDSMCFPDAARLKFRPDDRAHSIYTSLYGGRVPWGDALECESFVWELSDQFLVDEDVIVAAWHPDVTLRELFACVTSR